MSTRLAKEALTYYIRYVSLVSLFHSKREKGALFDIRVSPDGDRDARLIRLRDVCRRDV